MILIHVGWITYTPIVSVKSHGEAEKRSRKCDSAENGTYVVQWEECKRKRKAKSYLYVQTQKCGR